MPGCRRRRALRSIRGAFCSGHDPTARSPELSDKDRAERLALLAERLCSPDGLDRDIAKIEQLTDALLDPELDIAAAIDPCVR